MGGESKHGCLSHFVPFKIYAVIFLDLQRIFQETAGADRIDTDLFSKCLYSKRSGTVKQIGSRFILLYTFTSTLKKFLPIVDEEGMLGPDWQYFASDSLVSIGLLELLPAGCLACIRKPHHKTDAAKPSQLRPQGCFLISFVNKGPLYPKFQELLSKMDLDDWIGPNSTERYKLEANLIDAVHLNASMQHITKLALQLIRSVPSQEHHFHGLGC